MFVCVGAQNQKYEYERIMFENVALYFNEDLQWAGTLTFHPSGFCVTPPEGLLDAVPYSLPIQRVQFHGVEKPKFLQGSRCISLMLCEEKMDDDDVDEDEEAEGEKPPLPTVRLVPCAEKVDEVYLHLCMMAERNPPRARPGTPSSSSSQEEGDDEEDGGCGEKRHRKIAKR